MGFQADRDIWSLLPRNSICKIHKSPPSTHPSTKIIHSGVWLYLDLLYSITGFTSSTSPSEPESRQKGKKDTSQQSKRSVWAKCQIAQILSTQMICNPNFLFEFYFQNAGFFQILLDLVSKIPSRGKSTDFHLVATFPNRLTLNIWRESI